MNVRWTRKAFADLDSIFQAISRGPHAAERVLRALLTSGRVLADAVHASAVDRAVAIRLVIYYYP